MNGIQSACVGRLVRDAEQHFLPNGTEVLNFAIAVDSSRAETEFVGCAIYANNFANLDLEDLLPRLRKGAEVYVRGPLTLNRYTDSEGRSQARLHLACADLAVLELPSRAPSRPARRPGRANGHAKLVRVLTPLVQPEEDDSLPW